MANLYYLNQYFTTTLSVVGGIDASQTADIVIQSVTGIDDTTKPGVALINYADPLNETIAEWVTYTSINSTTKELVGVTRGAEKGSGKVHSNGVTVAFPISESHVNNLANALSIGGVATNGVTTTKDEDDMATDSATALATQQSIKAYVDNQTWSDGWIPTTDTWTYASASTFTIAGEDRTAIFTPGTKLKFTQTTEKYATVASSSFSTNTTVTIIVNTDYTIANAAITAPFYSYVSNPPAFPVSFSFTVTANGFTSNPSGMTGEYSIIGNRTILASYRMPNAGTSNATTFTFNLPVNVATTGTSHPYMGGALGATDNGSYLSSYTVASVYSAGSTLSLGVAGGSVGWTASGNKQCTFSSVIYPF